MITPSGVVEFHRRRSKIGERTRSVTEDQRPKFSVQSLLCSCLRLAYRCAVNDIDNQHFDRIDNEDIVVHQEVFEGFGADSGGCFGHIT